eukprot:359081-Chlamydomonas_euryale.AAC.10
MKPTKACCTAGMVEREREQPTAHRFTDRGMLAWIEGTRPERSRTLSRRRTPQGVPEWWRPGTTQDALGAACGIWSHRAGAAGRTHDAVDLEVASRPIYGPADSAGLSPAAAQPRTY